MKRRELLALAAGTAIAWPLSASAQQKPMPVIGFLGSTSPGPSANMPAFHLGLKDTGHVEGRNVAIEYRWAEGRYDQLPALAAGLVGRNVDVIVAQGTASARAARSATSTIPIAFVAGDPVAAGLVASLSRPEGNLTGVSIVTVELAPKRIELISELVPKARLIALLVNPNNLAHGRLATLVRDAKEAAATKGLTLSIVSAANASEIDVAFATIVRQGAGGIVVAADPYFDSRRDQFVAVAARNAIPTIYALSEFPAAGGLVSYGPSFATAFRGVGVYVGKILGGAKPADLPVEQPTKFELAINLKTAKALGLTVPPAILARADEVIE